MLCKKCGQAIDDNAKFCKNCSTQVEPQASVTTSSFSTPAKSIKKSWIIIVLIAIVAIIIIMIYKLGTMKDLDKVSGASLEVLTECRSYLEILDAEYGADRDIDRDDGGYVILADSKASDDEVREVFDYTQYLCEFEKNQEMFTTRLYLVSQDYGVVIITVKEKKDDN